MSSTARQYPHIDLIPLRKKGKQNYETENHHQTSLQSCWNFLCRQEPGGRNPPNWGVFNSRYDQIPAINDICYGLCFSNVEGAAEDEFEYVAATEVKDDKTIPEGMVYREVPEYKYAVFTHHGKLDKLGDTYDYNFNAWLPQSGQKVHPDKYDMELYDERFIPDSDDSAFDIYIAIQ